MKAFINTVLLCIILFCLIYGQKKVDPDIPTIGGIFCSISEELNTDVGRSVKVFDTLGDVYSIVKESSLKTIGHPIHDVIGLEDYGTKLGVKIEMLISDASIELNDAQRKELSILFLNEGISFK